MATLIGTVTKGMVLPPYLEHVAAPAHEDVARKFSLRPGDRTGVSDTAKSGDIATAIHQTLDIKKMTQAKIVSLAAEPIQVLAVGACVSPLIGSRGGGDCPICQAKVQTARGQEERSLEKPVFESQYGQQQHAGGTMGVLEHEHHLHLQTEDDGEESDDSYAAWGWDSEDQQPAGPALVGADSAPGTAGVAVGTSAVVAMSSKADGTVMQERHPGQHGVTRTGSLGGPTSGSMLPALGAGSGVGGGTRRPQRSTAHHSGVATGGGVAASAGAGPSIQAMSAQWRQGISLQRPVREPGRKTAAVAGRSTPSAVNRTRGQGWGAVGSGPAVRSAARADSPTRSHNSDGDRSSRSDES